VTENAGKTMGEKLGLLKPCYQRQPMGTSAPA
jgi:hypothetical protein